MGFTFSKISQNSKENTCNKVLFSTVAQKSFLADIRQKLQKHKWLKIFTAKKKKKHTHTHNFSSWSCWVCSSYSKSRRYNNLKVPKFKKYIKVKSKSRMLTAVKFYNHWFRNSKFRINFEKWGRTDKHAV